MSSCTNAMRNTGSAFSSTPSRLKFLGRAVSYLTLQNRLVQYRLTVTPRRRIVNRSVLPDLPGERLMACRNDQRAESMTTIKAMRLASLVTAINVLVASGFSIAAIIRPQYLVPADPVPTEASLLLAMYAAARTIPLALFALAAIYKRAVPALLILGALAGAMQLLDAGIGLFEHDLGKCAGPLFIAALQFFVMYLLHRSVRITPQTTRG